MLSGVGGGTRALGCAILFGAALLGGCGQKQEALVQQCAAPEGEVAIPAGAFMFGAAAMHAEEGPPQRVEIDAFSIDRAEVTNRQFAAFIDATGYVTQAERAPDPALYPGVPAEQLRPSSPVFVGGVSVWRIVEGAYWRAPEGPGSSIEHRMDHPVVQVGYEDALAYARWRGRDLPTEAEWEYAARGGIDGARYVWGDERETPQRANYWQGVFPAVDTGEDGHRAQTAPIGCYEPNGFGLYDMAGNVWEWTSTTYPGAPETGPAAQHTIKGGSFLCADNFCYRFRPPARQPGPPDTGSSHIGFRTVARGA